MNTVTRRVVVVAAVFAVVAGTHVVVSRIRSVPESPEAQVVTTASCLSANVLTSSLPGPLVPREDVPDAPEPGRIPEGFDPVRVVVCEFAGDISMGQAPAQIMRETRRAGDVPGVVDAFSAPSRTPTWFPSRCEEPSSVPAPTVWLLDSEHRAIRPAFPLDECDLPQRGPMLAVARLDVVETIDHPVLMRG